MSKTVSTILDFKSQPQQSLDKILIRSDKEIGGYSTANFSVENGCGQFQGYLNLDLPKDNPEVTRSGYAMFRTKDQKESWLSGSNYWDWSNYQSLALRVKGDTRKYLVNIQANTPLVTDLFQHRLFLDTPGEWETVVIPLNDFVMTNWGVIQDGSEINKLEVKTIGIGLLDKQYGPFSLEIDWIKVMTGTEVENLARNARIHKITSQENEIRQLEEQEQHEHGAAISGGKYDDPKSTVF
jgi:NADH dehydrogenase [ubiquinone] 1 alpha subcomplex assembly factor 1